MSKFFNSASLRQMLTVPYVLLVLLAAAVIGGLSYTAGRDAVDTLSDHVLSETVNRIAQAIDKHISGSEAVLETAFPTDVPAPASISNDIETLRTRFWLATSIHRDPNNYAYYGNRNGQFLGLLRYSEAEAEMRLRLSDSEPRSIYHYTHIKGALKDPVKEERMYDPRERPWYKAGQSASSQTWTAVYIDFKTLELTSTRAKRVNNAAGEFEGVVATDLSLQNLNEFLKGLKLSANGFAFVVEKDGNLLATSRGPHLRKGPGENNQRLNAAASDDPWIASTYKAVKALTDKGEIGTHTTSFDGPSGETVQAGYVRLHDRAGLDWIVAVAVPRNDFMYKVTQNVHRTVWMSLFACLMIVLVGLAVLHRISKDLSMLSEAAREMGEGIVEKRIPVDRKDDIGKLAQSFANMQQRLLTDRLTGIANREAMTRRIEDRILTHWRDKDMHPFAVLFVDLNHFKKINDQYGHDAGDKALIEVAHKLSAHIGPKDACARYGGDEFVVLIDSVSHRNEAAAIRDKLEAVLAAPLNSLPDIVPNAAIGLAMGTEEGQDIDTLLKHADADMYSRKQARVNA